MKILITESQYQKYLEFLDEDLKKWFDEKWVDVSTKKDGEHPPCGRNNAKGSNRKYPVCRPKNIANKMSKEDKEKMTRKKRKAEKTKKGKSPSRVKFDDKYEKKD